MSKFFAIFLVFWVTSCSEEAEERAKSGLNYENLQSFVASEEEVVESVEQQLDEAVTSIMDEMSSSAFGLVGTETNVSRECIAENGTVTVKVDRSHSKTVNKDRPRFKIDKSVEVTKKITRVWSKTNEELECNTNGSHVKLPKQALAGAKLQASFERTRKKTSTWTKTEDDSESKRINNSSAKGTRSVEFESITFTDEKILIVKKVTKDTTKTRSFTKPDGETEELSLTVSTKIDSPFKVTIERSATDRTWLSRTIHSGTLVEDNSTKGFVSEYTFNEVLYNTKGLCNPISGKIDITLYPKPEGEQTEEEAKENKLSYSIDFSNTDEDGPTIEGEGISRQFSPDGCDIEVQGGA